MSYKQRLALMVHRAVASSEAGVSFPYGFERYAKAAATTRNKRLTWNWS